MVQEYGILHVGGNGITNYTCYH